MKKTDRIHFIIYTEPRSKKNSQQIAMNKKTGVRFVVQSETYKRFEKECKSDLYPIQQSLKEPINYPINIKCLFYKSTKHKCDLTNLLEAIDDVLVKDKIIEDDNYNILVSHDGSRVFVDKDNPRIEITISKLEEDIKKVS